MACYNIPYFPKLFVVDKGFMRKRTESERAYKIDELLHGMRNRTGSETSGK